MSAAAAFSASSSAPLSPWLRPPGPLVSPDRRTILREAFSHRLDFPAVLVPKKRMQSLKKALRPLLLNLTNFKPEVDKESDKMVVLLDPDLINQWEDLLSLQDKTALEESEISMPPTVRHAVELTYDNYKLDHVLRAILPPEVKVSAFSQIGHIAHLNLKPESLPYKWVIGQAILDKLKIVRTVVNKLDQIDNTYRNFQMELIAGEENYIAMQAANGCTFHMDFSKVYWNSRLVTEHSRLIAQMSPGDVLYDAFAGVGPFAVPAARKGCRVLANDLNPESFRWLQHNARANATRRTPLAITCFNLDAKEFIETVVAGDFRWEGLTSSTNQMPTSDQNVTSSNGDVTSSDQKVTSLVKPRRRFLVMNLPALAVTFLSALRNLAVPFFVYKHFKGRWQDLPDVEVRCYCFLRESDSPAADGDEMLTRDNVESVVKRTLGVRTLSGPGGLGVHFVRNVAAAKDMFRLDFVLTGEMLREIHGVGCQRVGSGEEPEAKMTRNEEK